MSQTKYEVMVILDPEVDDRTVAPTLEKFFANVPTEGGTVEKIDIWGRRKFAYPIKKRSEGTYAVINLECDPATVIEVDRLMNISESVLRTKVQRYEDAVVDLRIRRDRGKTDSSVKAEVPAAATAAAAKAGE